MLLKIAAHIPFPGYIHTGEPLVTRPWDFPRAEAADARFEMNCLYFAPREAGAPVKPLDRSTTAVVVRLLLAFTHPPPSLD